MKNNAAHLIPQSHAARIIFAAAALLLIPLVAMQLSDDVVWTFSDFVIAAVLLLGAGFAYELFTRKFRSPKQKLVVAAGVFAVLALVWVELAVGLFGTPFAGS
jgi:predicted membrane channel-forming protein YqfA (hemolysin III family)